jgi:hypothetical protein
VLATTMWLSLRYPGKPAAQPEPLA